MEKYDEWNKRKRQHLEEFHGEHRQRSAIEDPSCEICFKLREQDKINEIREFWKWYSKLLPAETYNKNTLRGLGNILIGSKEKLLEWSSQKDNEIAFQRITRNLDVIIESVSYSERLRYEIRKLREWILKIILMRKELFEIKEGEE